MSAPEPRQIRRDAVERLAAAVRALADAAAETGVEPTALDGITREIATLTERLAAVTDDTPYSGLVWAPGDFSVPEGPMPLNPIIGMCSPVRPDVQLRFSDGEIVGHAVFTKRFVGPPGYAHGGIERDDRGPDRVGEPDGDRRPHDHQVAPGALPASTPARGGRHALGCLRARRRWVPARFTVTTGEEIAVEGTADLVPFDRLERRASPS